MARYNDGTYDHWARLATFEQLFRANYTESRDIPSRFAIVDKPTGEDPVTGTATAPGEASGGRCTLEDETAAFESAAEVRDIIHNVTDESSGLVVVGHRRHPSGVRAFRRHQQPVGRK